MFNIVLFQPQIPPNTGNVIRLCANTGCSLHLIEPLGFELDEKRLLRAGLDYHEWATIQQYQNLEQCRKRLCKQRWFPCTSSGTCNHAAVHYQKNDVLLFGSETSGLPHDVLHDKRNNTPVRIPMLAHSRCLNLSNAVAIIVYEAWRQQDFFIH